MTRLLESAVKRATEGTAFRALESYVSGAVVYSDNFNRADTTSVGAGGAGLGAEWLGNWQIASNQAKRSPIDLEDFVVFLHDLGTLDMWVEADVTPNTQYGVVNVRRPSSNANEGYLGFWNPAEGGHWEIGMQIGASYTNVASGGTGGGATKKLRLEAEGSALRLYADGVLQMSGTNTTINSVDFPNHRYAGLNSNSGPTVDNFRCGALPWTP